MLIQPLAQCLPEEILDEILYHVTGLRSVRRTQYSKDCPSVHKDLLAFLSVCASWRSVALPLFYMDMRITTDGKATGLIKSFKFVHDFDDVITHKAEGFVRRVQVQVPLIGVLNGSITDLLSIPKYAQAVFASVFHLTFYVSFESSPEGDEEMFSSNAMSFCDRMRQLFPNYKTLYVNVGNIRLNDYCPAMSDIITRMTKVQQGAFYYTGTTGYLHMSDLNNLAKLTHVDLLTTYGNQDVTELVRCNSQTLEYAKIGGMKGTACVRLIQGTDNTALAYPRLRKLYIYAMDKSRSSLCIPPEKGAPFPILSHLSFTAKYPFISDIMFRGNNKSLEYMELFISSKMAKTIRNFDIFAKGRYPKLNYIALKAWYRQRLTDEVALAIAKIPFEIGPQVNVVNIQFVGDQRDSIIMDAIRLSAAPLSLRYLTIKEFRLSIAEVVEIFKKLTNLDHFAFWTVEPWVEGERPPVDLSMLPALHKEHYPVVTRLRSLKIEYRNLEISRQVVADILMIASLIPSLRFVSGFWLKSKSKDFIKELLDSPSLAPFAEQLGSLKYLEAMSRDTPQLSIS
ncbi:hypothetical protein GGI12_003658 [Dipsacomyces acuminosporus]|nr:hypothetical protein GGI12_003658 [Dipsacomyces acuminosporus]